MTMTGKDTGRGGRVIRWVEKHCRVPLGPDRGKMLRLSPVQYEIPTAQASSAEQKW